MKNITEMNNDELLEELDLQDEWSVDDAFELAAFGRGDNGFARDKRIAELHQEAEARGLRKPLPLSEENDSDFDDIKKYMEILGFEWRRPVFRKWGKVDGLPGNRRQIDYCSFQDAATKWHSQYVQQAQEINRYEMWGAS